MFDQLASSRKDWKPVLEESWPHGRWLHLTTTHAEMCLEVVRLPIQTQAKLRFDHAECVTKMPRSQWHLSQELKCLDSASINTSTNAYTCINRSLARKCCQKTESFGVLNIVIYRRGGRASSRADLRQSPLLCAWVYRSRYFEADGSQTVRTGGPQYCRFNTKSDWLQAESGINPYQSTKLSWVWLNQDKSGFTLVSCTRL